jgi:hypothetical protein
MGTPLIVPALGIVLACASAGLGQGRGGTIEGKVYALPGKTLANAVVVACPVENNACDEAKSKSVLLRGNGPSASFQIAGLEAAPHLVLAWRDVNANGEVESGDELAVYARNGQTQFVTPPASRLELRLQVFTGDFAALLGPAQPSNTAPTNPAPSSPAVSDARALVGLWSTTGATPLELANAPGIVDTSAGSYRFEVNGRYTSARMLESDGPVLYMKVVIYDEGAYTVKGDAVTFSYSRRLRSWRNTDLQTDKTSQGTQTYRWAIRPSSSGDGTMSLYLTDEDGTVLEYPRR